MDDVARGGAAGAETSEIGAVAAPGRERRMTASRKRGGHSLGAGFDQLFHQLGDGPIVRGPHPVLLGKGQNRDGASARAGPYPRNRPVSRALPLAAVIC